MTLETRLDASLQTLGVRDDDRIAIACSGGADSIALVHLLAQRARTPAVLHVDHGLRDTSSDDARFVKDMAERLGLAYLERRVDVTRENGSLEAGARRARYAALEEMAHKCGARFVATAHTLGDQAETVLLRLMRGGGLDAIAPVRGVFIRPLLGVRRAELRGWLERHRITWREDPTNLDERFERNWVRNVVLPLMSERRPGVAQTLARVAQRERLDHEALDVIAADVFSRAAIDDVGVLLSRTDLELVPPAIASRVVRSAFRYMGCDPSSDAVESVLTLASRRFRWTGVDVWRLPEGIAFIRQSQDPPAPVPLPASAGGVVEAKYWGIKVRVGEPGGAPWRWRCTLPADARSIEIRSRRPGDRVPTRSGTKKVQDVLVDAKVPQPLRTLVPVIDIDGSARAVVGLRSADVTESGRVVDVEPFAQTWSRERAWITT